MQFKSANANNVFVCEIFSSSEMARKRLPKRISDINRSSASNKTDTNSTKTINNDVSSSVKVTLLIIVGICIVGFLFYPDISNLIESFKNVRDKPTKHDTKYNFDNGEKPRNVLSENKRKKQEDLMEDELDWPKEKDSGISVDVSEDDSNDDRNDVRNIVSETNSEDTKQVPITSDDNYIKLEPEKTKTIHIHKADDSKPNLKNKPNDKQKQSDRQIVSDKQKVGNKEKHKTPEVNISEGVQHNLPDDIKKFKPKYQKTVTAKKIFSGGRRIPPVELLHQKETNSSVK